ncbi:protocadherin-1 [Biomphalaria pfeifferi]|uniref:Protocadherin-1 n=1 Tax=Biomphalaria pfeifferi TaxID=112525 RepID=A0AAD8C3A1_BIOPF|nr:protocadherin-1 [Biomphalaria pfeifferi]
MLPVFQVVVMATLLHASFQAQLMFDVKEGQPPPVLVGNVASGMGLGYRYILVSPLEFFTVDTNNGDLFTKVTLDREGAPCKGLDLCILNVSITATAPNSYDSISAGVKVVDINDQLPDFSVSSFQTMMSESALVNTMVPLPVATDADYDPRFRVQNYSLVPDIMNTFDLVINRTSRPDGSVDLSPNLRLIRKLDRETTPSYLVTLMASDGDHEVRLPINIVVSDVNDYTPAFKQKSYSKTITENTTKDTVMLKVTATDPDANENGRVSYELVSNFQSKILDSFKVLPDTGEIVLTRALDKEGGTTVFFDVRAYDHGVPSLSSLANVSVTIEDTINDPPMISLIFARMKDGNCSVSETEPSGMAVAVILVTDRDTGNNGVTSCSVDSDHFKLTSPRPPSEYLVVLSSALDREQQATYVVPISCWDKGSPPLTSTAEIQVFVEDVNDNPPVFTSAFYQMAVKENQRPLEFVGKVFATDADEGVNAQLRYYLETGVKAFRINETTGYLYTSGPLDRENVSSYSFKVFASDMSMAPLTASATVSVDVLDVNDNAPQFSSDSYRFKVTESASVDFLLGYVNASDPDIGPSGTVGYALTSYPSQPDPPFAISPITGALTLARGIDYETEAHYNFKVIAIDGGVPRNNKSVDVWVDVIDENDNSPVIAFPGPDNQSVVLNLGVSPGHEVIQVVSHDLDSGENGRLSYSLSAPNTSVSRLFWMNEDTGLVTLVAPLTLGDVQTYNIIIGVRDNGQPQHATQALLRVDIVEQSPRARVQESYTTIVIIMVCVTLFVAIVVLVTLCFIKYLDKKKFNADKHHHQHQKLTFDPISKTTAVYLAEGGGGDEVMEKAHKSGNNLDASPTEFQQQRFGSQIRNGKKCVTFDSAIRESDVSMSSDSVFTQPDVGFVGLTFNPPSLSTFNRSASPVFNPSHKNSFSGVSSSGLNIPNIQFLQSPLSGAPTNMPLGSSNSSRSNSIANNVHKLDQGLTSQLLQQDQVVDVALQNHNALVRSMRHNRRTPDSVRQLRPSSASHETDLCSSSSVETSDSGHGGSELDVSVIKMNV